MSESKPRKTVQILKVETDSTSMMGVIRKVQFNLEKDKKIIITTPNPEIVLKSLSDGALRRAINESDIRVPDGIGLAAAVMFLQMRKVSNPLSAVFVYLLQGIFVGLSILFEPKRVKRQLNIIKGRVLFVELIKIANKKNWKVYLLGGGSDTSRRTKHELLKNYKSIEIRCSAGPVLNEDAVPVSKKDKKIEKDVIEDINDFEPHLLFVAFGAPKQEKWLNKWIENLDIGMGMVVGGAFDSYVGNIKLPPKWIEESEFEWMWRLVNQPLRVIRIYNAVIRFSWKVYLDKIKNS